MVEIKQFTLIVVDDQISTTGNMSLQEVASILVTLAYGQGQQDAARPNLPPEEGEEHTDA